MSDRAYITLTTPGTKKVSVAARRIGSRDRMAVIAVCNEETIAERIVDALNLLQKKEIKLEVPAQRVLAEVRAALTSANTRNSALASKVRELENVTSQLNAQLRSVSRDLASMTDRALKAEAAVKENA